MNNISGVIKSGLCLGCGICAYSDSIGKTVYSDKVKHSIPVLNNENKKDEPAFDICPGKGYNIVDDSQNLYPISNYDLELGRVFQQYAAYSNNPEILKKASSGGLMSHLAIELLERKIVDRVLVTQFAYSSDLRTVCVLAKSKNDILQSQGSKYCPVDLSKTIREIKRENIKVAIIGTPCQIAGIRNIQKIDKTFSEKIVITIANFCGGFKDYKNISLISKRKGIDPKKITYFRFRGNGQPGSLRIEEKSGKSAEDPYPKYVGLTGISKHLRCHLCVDATGELADIACGDAWLPRFIQDEKPWSIVITRNKIADDIMQIMINSKLITTKEISLEEIKTSQIENLTSKKIRQKSRFYLYQKLGYTLPKFDGGYFDNEINLKTELKVFFKHFGKDLLERLGLFYFIYKKIRN